MAERIAGHSAECMNAMYRGPHVCICGANPTPTPERPEQDEAVRTLRSWFATFTNPEHEAGLNRLLDTALADAVFRSFQEPSDVADLPALSATARRAEALEQALKRLLTYLTTVGETGFPEYNDAYDALAIPPSEQPHMDLQAIEAVIEVADRYAPPIGPARDRIDAARATLTGEGAPR